MSETEDFAALFEASHHAKRIEQGQTVDGTVVAIGPEVAFVDVGGKGEATISIDELKNADGGLEVTVGDRLQAVVVSMSDGIVLSRRLARGAANRQQLEDAFHTRLPVEGRVEKVVKGGYEVRIAGQRAFCPFSQIDTARGADPSAHEGQVYTFRITEFRDGGRNLVVSRRTLVEEEQRAAAAHVKASIVPDAVLTGRVVSVRDFGAFVDLGGGVQGLLHVSEMGWSRVGSPSDVLQPGEEITVKVLQTDEARERISLGLKQLTDDPWLHADTRHAVGRVVTGRVTRVADFGAFVELEPGVEALAHASTFAPTGRPQGWKGLVAPGMTGAFEILSIDLARKRMGVALVPEGSARAGAASGATAVVPGARVTGTVERHEPFGVFVFLAPGRTGLVPLSETGLDRDGDVAKAFPVGSAVEVVVLDVEESGRRIRLSIKAVRDAHEAEALRAYTDREEAAHSERLGTLADKLRSALGTRRP
jgi:small subunit ribosomal protein S1